MKGREGEEGREGEGVKVRKEYRVGKWEKGKKCTRNRGSCIEELHQTQQLAVYLCTYSVSCTHVCYKHITYQSVHSYGYLTDNLYVRTQPTSKLSTRA